MTSSSRASERRQILPGLVGYLGGTSAIARLGLISVLALLSILSNSIRLHLLVHIVFGARPSSLGLSGCKFLVHLILKALLLGCTRHQLDEFLSVYSTLLLVLIMLCDCSDEV